jgi:hypothetical protein
MRRRGYLAALTATATATTTAGCLGGFAGTQARLAAVPLFNLDDVAHTLALEVICEGETEHERRYDLPAAGPDGPARRAVRGEWPAAPGEFTVRAGLDGAAPTGSHTVPDGAGSACYRVGVQVRPDGSVRYPNGTVDASECRSG